MNESGDVRRPFRTESILSAPDGSLRASRSDLSVNTTSPRPESNATSSTAANSSHCFGDVPNRKDLGAELMCVICDQLFDRPVMVACGHSFCEGCIERRTRQTRECAICSEDVGELHSMIPSITLDNIVRKMLATEVEGSLEELFICDDKAKQRIERSTSVRTSGRSRRRPFFSIKGPTVYSSPMVEQRRIPLPLDTKPIKSSLKSSSDMSATYVSFISNDDAKSDEEDESVDILDGHVRTIEENSTDDEMTSLVSSSSFRRNGFGRRSERFTSATQSKPNAFKVNESIVVGECAPRQPELKRNSLLRRSLNAIRSKAHRRSFGLCDAAEEKHKLLATSATNENTCDEPPSSAKSSSKSMWRRLFMPKRSKVIDVSSNAVVLTRCVDKRGSVGDLVLSQKSLGYYMGIGKKFERVAGGEEITLVVFGHTSSGKTSFARSVRKSFSSTQGDIRVLTVRERYLLGGMPAPPFPEGDNRLPHVVSMIVHIDNSEVVLDIVDPEYDDTHLPHAYMTVCDAAVLLLDVTNCASLLSAHQVQRNLVRIRHEHNEHVECEIVANIPSESSTHQRTLGKVTCDNLARNMKTTCSELVIPQPDVVVLKKVLTDLCRRVVAVRKSSSSACTRTAILV